MEVQIPRYTEKTITPRPSRTRNYYGFAAASKVSSTALRGKECRAAAMIKPFTMDKSLGKRQEKKNKSSTQGKDQDSRFSIVGRKRTSQNEKAYLAGGDRLDNDRKREEKKVLANLSMTPIKPDLGGAHPVSLRRKNYK